MYQPSPPAEPATPKMSSAATTVRQPKAQAALTPVMIDGSAAGKRTPVTRRQPRRPKLRAASCVVWLIVRKPLSVFNATGQIVASATTKMIDFGCKPNQIIASGKIAIDGNGLKTDVSTVKRSWPMREKTANNPSANQMSVPILIPQMRLISVL